MIETPEEFIQEIYKASADSRTMDAEIAKLIAARDAAICAEYAELLKMCGEALKATQIMMRFPIRERTFEITTPTMHAIDIALAALREAGVIE